MEEKDTVSLNNQIRRKKRVARMKTGIIMTMAIWMITSLSLCIGLTVKIMQLNQKIDGIEAKSVMVQQVASEDENPKSAAKPNDIQSKNVEEDAQADNQKTDNGEVQKDAQQPEQTAQVDQENMPIEDVKQKVYLTFDDGPSENTTKILDILKEKGVKATFFVVGNEDEKAKELYQRIVAEGHTLGMHSYSHKYSVLYESLDSFKDDMNQLKTYLTEITGVEPTIMRFPGGSSNQVSNTDMKEFIKFLNETGIKYYDWNVASGDATSQAYTPEELIKNVMRDVVKYDTSIVLMHDSSTKGTTVDALAPMIDQLQAANVDLLPINENTKLIQHIQADSVDE